MIEHQIANSKTNYNYNAYTYFNKSYSPHFHSNYEVIYLIKGNISVTVNGRTEQMSEGDIALILSNQIHSINSSNGSIMWIGVFSTQFVPYFASKIKELEGKRSVFHCDESTDRFITEKLIFAESSIMQKKSSLYAICEQYLSTVQLEKRNDKNNYMVCNLLDYIEKHFKENISLSELAAKFGYEYHYLSRLLNKNYGINFSETVNRYRVEYAVYLIQSTNKTMTAIASESGFKSIRSFNHVFKSVIGISPSEFSCKPI